MLYSEFIERVGRVRTEEEYHTKVEPEYYDFPGNKNEFCLQFIGRELHRVNDKYVHRRQCLERALNSGDKEGIEIWTQSVKLLDEMFNDLLEYRAALIKNTYH